MTEKIDKPAVLKDDVEKPQSYGLNFAEERSLDLYEELMGDFEGKVHECSYTGQSIDMADAFDFVLIRLQRGRQISYEELSQTHKVFILNIYSSMSEHMYLIMVLLAERIEFSSTAALDDTLKKIKKILRTYTLEASEESAIREVVVKMAQLVHDWPSLIQFLYGISYGRITSQR